MGVSPTVLILFYCLLIAFASLVGGWLPSRTRLTHLGMQLMLSFVSGVLLGVALLHMLPHAVETSPSVGWVAGCMLAGVLLMFFLLRIFHVHDRGEAAEQHPDPGRYPGQDDRSGDKDHLHHHGGRPHDHGHGPPGQAASWLGVFVGLSVHSLLDGVALAASVAAEAELGFGTFLAILLHKPLDALSVMSLMQTGNWSARSQALTNIGLAVTCPLGALLFWIPTMHVIESQTAVVGSALAFSAGFFLCIALSDLLPEVAFHAHDRIKLSTALLLGVVLAALIEMLHAGGSESEAQIRPVPASRASRSSTSPNSGSGGLMWPGPHPNREHATMWSAPVGRSRNMSAPCARATNEGSGEAGLPTYVALSSGSHGTRNGPSATSVILRNPS